MQQLESFCAITTHTLSFLPDIHSTQEQSGSVHLSAVWAGVPRQGAPWVNRAMADSER